LERNTLKIMKALDFLLTILAIGTIGLIIIASVESNTEKVIDKIDSTLSNTLASKLPALKTEYELEIISQDSVKIYNGYKTETINVNDIQLYMELDQQE